MKNRKKLITLSFTAFTALAVSLPAVAHHPMGGATPITLLEGLLSGFGHPIIGFDHLLFIFAVGIACYFFGQRITTIAAFLTGTFGGALLHVLAPGVSYADAWVAASLILLGVLFLRGSDFLKNKGAILLFTLSGVAHGYAYGETIVGAEATPVWAYLSGFTLVQFAIAMCGFAVTRYATAKKPAFEFLKATGGVLAVTGAGFLMFALAP